MRLWTLHPQYLDRQGLLAAWREGLLAQKVLMGGTRGYRKHPQLLRFSQCGQPILAIGNYLNGIFEVAQQRGYKFAFDKIINPNNSMQIDETDGQLLYEWQHLKRKLRQRSKEQYEQLSGIEIPQPHPFFKIVSGPVRPWERTVK